MTDKGTLQGLTVLFAEDDLVSAALLIHRMEEEGLRVLHYLDGSQALDGALANRVDLAVLDVKMPVMDGFELLVKLRTLPEYADLPVIMLTSLGKEEDIKRGIDLGADEYIVKPSTPTEVMNRARRLLAR